MKKFPSKATKTSGLRATTVLFVSILAFTSQIAGSARALDSELDTAAYKLLADRCADCHDGQSHELDVKDIKSLTAERGDGRDRFVAAGDAERSYLMKLIESDVMPKNSEPLSAEEKELLKQWINDGASFPEYGTAGRSFVEEQQVLQEIREFLSDTDKVQFQDRKFTRFFSLHVLANNRQLPDEKIQLAAAGLSKAINSLSRKRSIVSMQPVGESGVLFAINVRDLDWDAQIFEKWNLVLRAYPYGAKPTETNLQNLYKEIESIYTASGGLFDGFPYIRGEWFINEALRPPLYHSLLEVPETLAQLEEDEDFDHKQEFVRNQILRGGVLNSRVSSQSRIIDYHQANNGVWMSYDFLPRPANDPERSNIIRFPLGPQFEENKAFESAAFEHAGGEIIFTLANGLHGYMLIDEKGGRLDEGPIAIVSDFDKTSGNPVIVNGLSCIGCHRQGMVMFKDGLATGHGRTNSQELDKIAKLYRPDDLEEALKAESEAYLKKLKQVIGPFLLVGEQADTPIEQFPEPVSATAKLFQRDLQLEDVAAELGLESIEFLKLTIQKQPELKRLGLGVLVDGGAIKREHWETVGTDGDSVFQKVSRIFGFIPIT